MWTLQSHLKEGGRPWLGAFVTNKDKGRGDDPGENGNMGERAVKKTKIPGMSLVRLAQCLAPSLHFSFRLQPSLLNWIFLSSSLQMKKLISEGLSNSQ